MTLLLFGASAPDVPFHHLPVVGQEIVDQAVVGSRALPEGQGDHLRNFLEGGSRLEAPMKCFFTQGADFSLMSSASQMNW